jgi:hypothetical protein
MDYGGHQIVQRRCRSYVSNVNERFSVEGQMEDNRTLILQNDQEKSADMLTYCSAFKGT